MSSDSKRVLIIDDDPVIVELLRDYLADGRDAYVVETARNGQDGLAALRRQRPDVVLLDITMPEMDGLEVLKHIRGLDAGIPVIMVTGIGNPRAYGEAMRHGAFGFIPKPFSLQYLRHFVGIALATPAPKPAV